MLFSLLLIVLLSAFYLWLLRLLYIHIHPGLLAGALLWGGVSFGLALLLQTTLRDGALLDRTGIHLFSAPVLEEALKALPLLLVRLQRSRPAVIYGFAIGLGFAFAESALYLTTNPESSLGMALARVVSVHLIHGFGTGLVGLLAGRMRWALAAFVLAAAVHAGFNWLALTLHGSLLIVSGAYAGIGSMIVLLLLASRTLQQSSPLSTG